VDGGLFISDPIIDCIERKFAKTYQWAHRLELLAFYELQSTPMAQFRVPEVEAFVQGNLARSKFARVWLFDAANRTVLLSCDGSSRSQEHSV
jgi:hypothetical protein